MTVRTATDDDFIQLVKLYKSFFPEHNRFKLADDEIIQYLLEQSKEHEILVFDENGVKGALFAVNFGQSADGSHKLWKFRHFAWETKHAADELLKAAEDHAKTLSKTAKIELTIAENEEGLDWYKSNGYEQEAKLKNHYIWGETCFILSKSLN